MGLAGVVPGRLGWAEAEARALVPHVERILAEANWLATTEFSTIHYVMRFGEDAQVEIHCRNRPKYNELEVASQVAMRALHEVFLNRPKLRLFLCLELKRVLSHIQDSCRLPPLPALEDFLNRWPYAQQALAADACKATRV